MGENHTSYSSNNGLISRIYRELKIPKNQHPNEEMGTRILKGKDTNGH
jgi:hypothetical protein